MGLLFFDDGGHSSFLPCRSFDRATCPNLLPYCEMLTVHMPEYGLRPSALPYDAFVTVWSEDSDVDDILMGLSDERATAFLNSHTLAAVHAYNLGFTVARCHLFDLCIATGEPLYLGAHTGHAPDAIALPVAIRRVAVPGALDDLERAATSNWTQAVNIACARYLPVLGWPNTPGEWYHGTCSCLYDAINRYGLQPGARPPKQFGVGIYVTDNINTALAVAMRTWRDHSTAHGRGMHLPMVVIVTFNASPTAIVVIPPAGPPPHLLSMGATSCLQSPSLKPSFRVSQALRSVDKERQPAALHVHIQTALDGSCDFMKMGYFHSTHGYNRMVHDDGPATMIATAATVIREGPDLDLRSVLRATPPASPAVVASYLPIPVPANGTQRAVPAAYNILVTVGFFVLD
jgi:hypothetical protein